MKKSKNSGTQKVAKKNKDLKTKAVKKWYKTEWDFSSLYSGIADPKLEKDTVEIIDTYTSFAKTYAYKPGGTPAYMLDSRKLKTALDDYDKVLSFTASFKPLFYLRHSKNIDSQNQKLAATELLLTDRIVDAYNKVLFFEISLGRISQEKQKILLADNSLAKYHRFLSLIFSKSKYMLSEAEEKIINLKSKTSYDAWVNAQQKLATSQTVKFQGKDIPLAEAFYLRLTLPLKPRHKLHALLAEKFKSISHMAEAELNAIVSDKKTDDELRGIKQPYEKTVVEYDNDMPTVERLVNIVTKNSQVVHEFYKLKAELFGLKKLTSADVSVPIEKKKKTVPLDQAIETISAAFEKADPEFKEFFHQMLREGKIDFYPKKGKRGGAYCSESSQKVPIYIMMNYTNVADSMMTLAHEMGHAIHSHFSTKHQPEIYSNYTISVAEVASTFFEQILFGHIFETLSEEEKVYALLADIEDNVGTIFRQIQFFNFEKDLHKIIREKGSMSKEEMAALYVEHSIVMNGPAYTATQDDGYFFTNVPHFRYFFYVYTYAYGQLISRALYAKYKADPSFMAKIKQFLSAGGSKSPYEIFKSIGIDTSDPEFFKLGIKQLEEDLKKARFMAKKLGILKK